MSADNGIYVLENKAPFGPGCVYRVACCQAIENIDAPEQITPEYTLGDVYLVLLFGGSDIYPTLKEATRIAQLLDEEWKWTEYGICTIRRSETLFPSFSLYQAERLEEKYWVDFKNKRHEEV